MKKIVCVLLIVVLLTGIVNDILDAAGNEFLSINTEGTNVRSKPGTENTVVEKLSKGTYVLNMGTAKDKSGALWYKIYNFNSNKTGYVAAYLLKKTGITFSATDESFVAQVNTDFLNVRKGPGTEFNYVKRLASTAKINVIRVIKRSDGEIWYKYKEGNSYYFVASWYTKKIQSSTPPNNNQQPPTNNTTPSKTEPKISLPGTSTDFVNLRKGPSTDYEKVTLINKGDAVTIVGAAKNDRNELWLQLLYKSSYGFSMADYFDFNSSILNFDISTIGAETKTSDNTNLRDGPATSFSIKQVIPKDTTFKIVGTAFNKDNETWFEISYNNNFYWLRSDTITPVKNEKGLLENVLWEITQDGIDIKISGKLLKEPNINTLSDPIRLVLIYKNTNILNTTIQYDLPIYPFTRISTEMSESDAVLSIYLLSDLPYEFEDKSETLHIIHFNLPKVNEEIVEVGGRVIFANTQKIENSVYISVDDFLDAFSLKLNTDNSVNFFGKTVTIEKELTKISNGENFISLQNLKDKFNVSVSDTGKEIYIDPILINFENKNQITTLTFTFPANAKKTTVDKKEFFVFNAEKGIEIPYTSEQRNATNPPKIYIPIDANSTLEVQMNVVKISVKVNGGTLSGKTIVIDPGHGSYSGQYLDYGASGYSQTKEANIVLDIALRLKVLLEKEGAKVILTHTTVDDVNNPTLQQRAIIANSSGGELFISIHLNASTNKEAKGTETYYWYDSSKKFAQAIQNALVSNLDTLDRGTKKEYLYVCREVTTMPAILTEVAFISNPDEESLLKNSAFLDKVAAALYEGIKGYLSGQ